MLLIQNIFNNIFALKYRKLIYLCQSFPKRLEPKFKIKEFKIQN